MSCYTQHAVLVLIGTAEVIIRELHGSAGNPPHDDVGE